MSRFVVCLILASLSLSAQEWRKAAPTAWKPLFNGRDLTGWTPKIRGFALGENYGDTFRVRDGMLEVSYDKYDKFAERFGHLFWRDKLSNYVIAVEYRFIGEQAPAGP